MKIGLLVNPIAGMGGRVGLKGTDGVVEEAIARGAEPVAPLRAHEFLESLGRLKALENFPDFSLFTCPGSMGSECVHESSLSYETVDIKISTKTSSVDTQECVLSLPKVAAILLGFLS